MRVALFCVTFLLIPISIHGDLDVVVSSGSPLDWLGDLSRPTPSKDRTNPAGPGDRRTVVEEAPRIFSSDVYRFAKITTVDLIGEIPWTVRRGTPTDSVSSYPPKVTDDVFWLAMATIIRRLLHPALMSESEAQEYLVHLGTPATEAAQLAKTEPALRNLCKALEKRIPDIPKNAPVPPKGKDPIDSMLYRLTWEDLTISWPFAFDGKFAARISLLGSEMIPYVVAASKSKHILLQRNAVVLLGRYSSASALDRVREMLRTTKDGVVRARALDAIARRKDATSVEFLQKLYKGTSDELFRQSIIRALGVIGDPKGLTTVASYLKRYGKVYGSAMTGLIAMTRLAGPKHKQYNMYVKRINPSQFKDKGTGRYRPSIPDAPGTSKKIIEQLQFLARAKFGDKKAQAKVKDLLLQGEEEDKNPRRGRFATFRGITRMWGQPAVYVLLETLVSMPKGADLLFKVAEDEREDLSVRVRAMIHLAKLQPDGLSEKMKAMVTMDQEYSIAESALRVLSTFDSDAMVEVGEKLIQEYAPNLAPGKKALIGSALDLLARQKAADASELIRILEHEIIVTERGQRKKKKEPKQDPRRMRNPKMEFESPTTFVEGLIVTIGRMDPPFLQESLRDVIVMKDMPGRAEALIVLARKRDKADLPVMLKALEDRDPWVRFMAYRSIQFALGKDHKCDWLYGSDEARARAVAQYAAWVKEAGE